MSGPLPERLSFTPQAMRWFAGHRPAVGRGLAVNWQSQGRWRGAIERARAALHAGLSIFARDDFERDDG